ncbi:MAG TPA: DNA translocase FtsK 4TM domain-containing protein, partial [Anaerolineales bacterium]
MPIRKPASPPKRSSKPRGKTLAPKSGTRAKARAPQPPPQRAAPSPSFWEKLSPERKLDVIGTGLAAAGTLILLGLISANRSVLVGGTIRFLSQLVGWGVYVLPLGLLVFGLWLVLRKIERIPPLSVERAVGSAVLFVWLLTLLHAIASTPRTAESVAIAGGGGGYIGSSFMRILWAALGEAGAYTAMLAWLVIALAMTLDISVQDLFRWMGPLWQKARASIPRKPAPVSSTSPTPVNENGLTPFTPAAAPDLGQGPVTPVPAIMGAPGGSTVIHWSLPQTRDILDAGSAPAINEDFIQQRARLIEDTLASFGAPAQVVEISRGPTITQFGVEPLFVESRAGRTRVRVSKIASLSDDLALALAAPRIRIQAPVPGRSYVGIEVPNDEMALVSLREVVESEAFQRNRKSLSFALGQDVAGHPITGNLENMPHLLIAGTTGKEGSIRSLRAEYLPSIYVSGAYDYMENQYLVYPRNWTVIAGVTMNLFSGGSSSSKVSMGTSELTSLQVGRDKLIDAVRLEVQRAYLEVQLSRQKVDVAAAAVAQAEENLRIQRLRYQEGVGTAIELLDAVTLLTTTQTNVWKARYSVQRAEAALLYAMGQDLTVAYTPPAGAGADETRSAE